jgi:hypothetical protein
MTSYTENASIITEIKEIIEKLNRYDPDSDFSRLSELLLQVREQKLWREVVREDGTPVRSFREFLDVIGVSQLPYFSLIRTSRDYVYSLKKYEEVRELVGEQQAARLGIRKSIELSRLFKNVPAARERFSEWVRFALENSWETVRAAVTRAIETQGAEIPRGRARAVWALDEQWAIVDQAYEAYTQTTDDPYWGRFIELAAASYLASLEGPTTILTLARTLLYTLDHTDSLTEEEAGALHELCAKVGSNNIAALAKHLRNLVQSAESLTTEDNRALYDLLGTWRDRIKESSAR